MRESMITDEEMERIRAFARKPMYKRSSDDLLPSAKADEEKEE